MKNYLNCLLLLAFSLFFYSCDKNEEPDLPDTFAKRVLIEKLTATWCSACGSASTKIQEVVDTDPEHIIVASYHKDSTFRPNANPTLQEMYSLSGQPAALLDRHTFDFFGSSMLQLPANSFLTQLADERLSEGTEVGVNINSRLSDTELNIDVEVATLVEQSETLFLHIYLIESGLSGPQSGNNDPNYTHDFVVRQVVTDPEGEPLDLEAARSVSAKNFVATLANNNVPDNMELIAFVTHKDATGLNIDIRNVQKADLGEASGW